MIATPGTPRRQKIATEGLSWKELIISKPNINVEKIKDVHMAKTKKPIHPSQKHQYYVCTLSSPVEDVDLDDSWDRTLDWDELEENDFEKVLLLNIYLFSHKSKNMQLKSVLPSPYKLTAIQNSILQVVSHSEGLYLFFRAPTKILILQMKYDGTIFEVNIQNEEKQEVVLVPDEGWTAWVQKPFNNKIYGLVKCLDQSIKRYKLKVQWVTFQMQTHELKVLKLNRSTVKLKEVFNYEKDPAPTIVLSNGEIFTLNLQHEEFETKIPRFNISLMQWNTIPYRISHKYRRVQQPTPKEKEFVEKNSTAMAYIGRRYFLVLTRTRVFELFDSDWKIFSDLKEMVHWKPFSRTPHMLATYSYNSMFLITRKLDIFEIDLTYVQKLLSCHSLSHDLEHKFSHPRKSFDTVIKVMKYYNPLPPSSNNEIFGKDTLVAVLHVHSIVLRKRVPHIFQDAIVNSDGYPEIIIHGFCKSAVLHAFRYVYTDRIDMTISNLNDKELWDLISLSQKLNLEKLIQRCKMIQIRKLQQSRKERGLPHQNVKQFSINAPQFQDSSLSTALDLFNSGNVDYFTQNFDLAIKKYSTSIEKTKDFMVKQLIKRCATYEKENELELALQDAELALQLTRGDKKTQAKIKMRVGYIMNLMNKPLEGYIWFCEAHQQDPDVWGLFMDPTALQRAGHKLSIEGYPIPEKYRSMYNECVTDLGLLYLPLVNSPEDSDFHFLWNRTTNTVFAHQFFMTLASGFFYRLCERHNLQNQKGPLELDVSEISPKCTKEDIILILRWIYTRSLPNLSQLSNSVLCNVLILCDFFDLYYLIDEFEEKLHNNLKNALITEVIQYIQITHRAGLRDLYNALFDIVTDRYDEVSNMDWDNECDIDEDMKILIQRSVSSSFQSSNFMIQTLKKQELEQKINHRRSLSGERLWEDLSPIDVKKQTRTFLSRCPVRLFGWSYESSDGELVIVPRECSCFGSVWGIQNIGARDHGNAKETFEIEFAVELSHFHPKFHGRGIHYSLILSHRVAGVFDKDETLPFSLDIGDDEATVRMGSLVSRYEIVKERDLMKQSFLDDVHVLFHKTKRYIGIKIESLSLNIRIDWDESHYKKITSLERLFMGLSGRNEREYCKQVIKKFQQIVDRNLEKSKKPAL